MRVGRDVCGGKRRRKIYMWLNHVTPGSVYRCFHPISGAGLGEYVGDVTGHCVDTDEQLPGNLRIVLSQGHKPQHFPLALSELMRECGEHAGSGLRLAIIGYRCLGSGQYGEELLSLPIG